MKLMIGSIAWRQYESQHIYCMMRLLQHPNLVLQPRDGDALVDRARAMVATRFLESDCDVLLTIDSDIVFRPEDALRMSAHAETHDLVAGLYVTRSAEICRPTSLPEPGTRIDFQHPELTPIKWAASGFLATHRRVFEALRDTGDYPLCHAHEKWSFYPFYTPMVGEDDQGRPIYLSEDYAFCERARRLGFSVYADPSVRLRHLGTYAYGLDDIPGRPERFLQTLTLLGDSRYSMDIAEVAEPEPVPVA